MERLTRLWGLVLGIAVAASLTFAAAPAQAQAPDKEFTISVGETLTFNGRGVSRVTIGLTSVVDAKPTSDNRQIIMTGKKPGVTTVNIFSSRGQKTLLLRVVGVNPQSLAQEVREVLGDRSGVDVRVVKGRVLLEGEVASEIFKRKIEKMVELYPNQVLNFTTFREAFVEGARMVALDVYFVQLAVTNRDRAGLHWGQFLGANYTFGAGDVPLYYAPDDEGIGSGITYGEANPARLPRPITITGGDGTSYWSLVGNLNLALDLMAEHGMIKTIQHGTIVTETGTDGYYHTGGTLLIRVVSQDRIAVEEIEYGLVVKAKPVLDFENRVKLDLDVEFSELDFANGVGDLPALRNNNVEAIVNMQEGQSVLVTSQESVRNTSNEEGFWLISRIPILGWLFKGRTYLGDSTDNALFVTPKLYEPGGKTERTLIQGAFERLLDAGADSEDIPELSKARAPVKSKASKSKDEKKEDKESGDEGVDLLEE